MSLMSKTPFGLQQAPKFGQRALRMQPVMGAVAGHHQVKTAIGEGQVLHIGELRADIGRLMFSGKPLDLSEHGWREVTSDDAVGNCGKGHGCVTGAAAGIKDARAPVQRRKLYHAIKIRTGRMHFAGSVVGGYMAESLLDLIFDILRLALQHCVMSSSVAVCFRAIAPQFSLPPRVA